MGKRTLTKGSARVLRKLTQGLEVGEGRKVDNAKGTYMAVSVNRLGEYLYSVSHYYEQNGDLVPDPDMVFFSQDGKEWMPCSFQNSLVYQEAATGFDDQGIPTRVHPAKQADMARFANIWMRNIKEQQGL